MNTKIPITWILEDEVFPNGDCLAAGAAALGHSVRRWTDRWWKEPSLPSIEGFVVFHGSLGNAERIHRVAHWRPGAYCATERFECSAWYPSAGDFLLHRTWQILPAEEFVENSAMIFGQSAADELFVRPNSPLKPFSGRVLHRSKVSLAALDHGFYFDDASLPVVVAPVRKVMREWRFVVVDSVVTSGSGYLADGRTPTRSTEPAAWEFASEVAKAIPPPESVYVMDVCECDGEFWLLELNPFSGADLYACDGTAIVRSISAMIEASTHGWT